MIMTIRAHTYSVAWPGIIAMWLIVFAPLASQLLRLTGSPEPIAVNCSAVRNGSATQHTLADSSSVCEYCDMLAQQAIAVTSLPALEIAAILLPTVLTVTLAPLTRADDGRASRCTEPEASSEYATPLQDRC
ncbi:hypothetical protein BOC59_09470 [Burkholderia pseudomallei]|nr:hypothetical protein BOC59_09470 [Burkholderia pseudomallei]